MPSTYEKIATNTLGSNQASITFSSISGAYTDLVLISFIRDTRAGTTYAFPQLRFNSDTGSNYSDTTVYGDGSSAASYRSTNQTGIQYGEAVGAAQAAGNYAPFVTNFQNYSNSTTYKTIFSRINNVAGSSGQLLVGAQVALWRSTSAITSITILADQGASSNLATGSTFTLYGIKAA
jgi:hypothetical protein